MRSDGERNHDIMIENEEDAVFVVEIKIEDLAAVPESALEFVDVQGRMPPVIAEK